MRTSDEEQYVNHPYLSQLDSPWLADWFIRILPMPRASVPFQHQDRQWDCRFNVQADDDLQHLLTNIQLDWDSGRLRYVLVGGLEIGTRQFQDDFGIRHVHVAAIFHNRVSKSSILKAWRIKTGNGYYLVPRNRDLPYAGWRAHHIKEYSKIDPGSCSLLELGELPADKEVAQKVCKSEKEAKLKTDDILIIFREKLEANVPDQEIFKEYPRTWLQYGEKVKAMMRQKADFFKQNGDPHIWVYGNPGTGKSALMAYVYPNFYKKNLHNKFFDLYDPAVHTHVMLEDLDHEAVERLSMQFIKTICDESGFSIDQKYKACNLARATVLVTSNFTIKDVIEPGPGVEQNICALMRRFWHVNIWELLRLLQLKLIPKDDIKLLKKQGNQEPGKLFMTWDYVTDTPLCMPIRSPQYYQDEIKNYIYG